MCVGVCVCRGLTDERRSPLDAAGVKGRGGRVAV